MVASTEFYSLDSLGNRDLLRKKDAKKVYLPVTLLSKSLCDTLWTQPPNTSEQVPRCLRICHGLPVIIQYNDMTELCITRGQEEQVVGWSHCTMSKTDKRKVLDVLYLELIDPPQIVKLPNLPPNIRPSSNSHRCLQSL